MKKYLVTLAVTALAVAGLSACAADDGKDAASEPTKVSVVLDWTPNTNHTGIYVAQEKGYYQNAGIDLDILGFSKAGVEAVMAGGEAEFGFSGVNSLAAAQASGIELEMVVNVQQISSFGVATRADSGITRPRDLDGKVLASYGAGATAATTKQMIINDGGKGEFDQVVVGAGSIEAVLAKRADFSEEMGTWTVIAAELGGDEINMFYPQDYGVPTTPANIGISVRQDFAKENPEVVRSFVQATVRGYQYAIDHPEEAAEILVAANPETKLDPELAKRSQIELSKNYWLDSQGRFGYADLERWQEFLDYLVESQLLFDSEGKVITTKVAANELATNEYLD
ncbi:MAG: ABC transporter substrate-binding protein [Trueperella sp.]|nr:ABC transporter substrate-binding protein [Trueperella sp.]